MTIDEAIKILHEYADGRDLVPRLKQQEASRLGFEALKVVKNHRRRYYAVGEGLLPGETEE